MLDKTDLHTHTIASGHAYSTRKEMIEAAATKGLEVYAITEHAPAMPGSCNSMYFMNYRALPRKHGEMTVLYGVSFDREVGGHTCYGRCSAGHGWWLPPSALTPVGFSPLGLEDLI